MRFKAPVGVSEEEKKVKNDITVDLSVKLNTKTASRNDELSHTVDYAELFTLTSEIVLGGSNLLEYISAQIGESVLEKFESITQVRIAVHKLHPPIGGDCKRATIKMKFLR